MGYSALPLAWILQHSISLWLYAWVAWVALVAVVALAVALRERRERRRLERALAVARQVPPFRKELVATRPFRPDIEAHHARFRFWLFPIVAIVLGLIVGLWSIWNVLR